MTTQPHQAAIRAAESIKQWAVQIDTYDYATYDKDQAALIITREYELVVSELLKRLVAAEKVITSGTWTGTQTSLTDIQETIERYKALNQLTTPTKE